MKGSILLVVTIFHLCLSSYSCQESSSNENFYSIQDESETASVSSTTSPPSIKVSQRTAPRIGEKRLSKGLTASGLNSAIEMLDLVTKLTSQTNEVLEGATKLANKNGFSIADPVTFIPTIIIYGAIKAVSYLVSMFIYVSSLIAPWQIDPNAKLSFIDLESLHNIDYEVISNSVRSVPERSFKLLDIKEEQCKTRAMCEIGQHIHWYWPRVATYIRLAVEQLNINDNNTVAILRGLGWADCDSLFRQSCQRSPFGKFYQILTSLNKLISNN